MKQETAEQFEARLKSYGIKRGKRVESVSYHCPDCGPVDFKEFIPRSERGRRWPQGCNYFKCPKCSAAILIPWENE